MKPERATRRAPEDAAVPVVGLRRKQRVSGEPYLTGTVHAPIDQASISL